MEIIITPTSKQNKRGDRRDRQNKSSGVIEVHQTNFPRQFKSNVIFKHKFRFQSFAAVTFTTLRSDLLGLLAMNLTSGTSNASIIAGVKLNRVEMFAVGGSSVAAPFTPAVVSVEWLSNYGPSSEISDTGNAMTPAKVVSSPPRNSLASFWSLTGINPTETLFTMVCPINCVVDVWVDLVLEDGESSLLYTTIAAGTAGQLYAGLLDRSAGAAAEMVPVSYQSLK
jgi:hypothetical protein